MSYSSLRNKLSTILLALAVYSVTAINCSLGYSADWPMWRYDAGHTAATPTAIGTDLKPIWSNQYKPRVPVWQDALNRDLMKYDRVFEPIVAGKRMFLGFNDSDKVIALDTSTGNQLWAYYADGPVRFAPVAHQDKLYFVSDDGCLYCLQQSDGKLLWKFNAAPNARKVLGNERVISTWPVRGGPVIADDTVYLAAGIWPFMGTFIYAIDAQTGDVNWINDGTSADYILQPHNSPAFAGVAPQGALTAVDDKLLIPGGRSVPAGLDRKTGKQLYFHLAKYRKTGGSSVFAIGNHFFAHERKSMFSMFSTSTGHSSKLKLQQPVLTKSVFYGSGPEVTAYTVGKVFKKSWSLKVDATGDLIKVGKSHLFAGGENSISIIKIAEDQSKAEILKSLKVEGNVQRIIAADDKLFAVTLEGKIIAFRSNVNENTDAKQSKTQSQQQQRPGSGRGYSEDVGTRAYEILKNTNIKSGYAVFYGAGDGNLLEAIARSSKLHILAIEKNQDRVDALRIRFDNEGLYGSRIAIIKADARTFRAPQYLASLTIVNDLASVSFESDQQFAEQFYNRMRPYGGTAVLPLSQSQHDAMVQLIERTKLPGAKIKRIGKLSYLLREGALPGAGTWTHQYGNIANTIKSDDKIVKLPLGVLWFGGNTNADVLPRHGHGPPEQVIGGRLFLQGIDLLSARDVYTGRVLWKVNLKRLGTKGLFFDKTHIHDPLTTKYGQLHIPGANARGTNFVATADHVYILQEDECHVLAADTGKTVNVFNINPTEKSVEKNVEGKENTASEPAKEKNQWAYLGIEKDYLIGGDGFAKFSTASLKKATAKTKKTKKKRSSENFFKYETSASAALVVMDRHTGKVKWRVDAKYGFIHNAIVVANDTLYCLDKYPPYIEQKLNRRGKDLPKDYRLLAIDMSNGKVRWKTSENIFGTWLSFSKEHGLLLQSTRPSRDMIKSESGTRMIVYQGDGGKVVWNKGLKYSAPPILHGEKILVAGIAYELKTGNTLLRTDPITGKKIPWTYSRSYGCNYPIASEHLLTFRSAAAGFYDLNSDGGSGHFGGFKSGCTSTLIAADGVLNAPDYTRTCSCSYQNQTSLTLVHMPELELWTHNNFSHKNQTVQRVGINFGAPGDRRAKDGTLWLEYPERGSPSPQLKLSVTPNADFFRHHSSRISGKGTTWIAASGIKGETEITIPLVQVSGSKSTPIRDGGYRIASSADDAEEAIATGKVTLTSSDLEFSFDGNKEQVVGLRFPKIDIPQGKTIKNAYVQFRVNEASKKKTELSIYGQASGDAEKFIAAKKNISKRKRTSSNIQWNPAAWRKIAERGQSQRTPNLSAILQEIINRPDWKKGNAVALLFEGGGLRTADSFDGDRNGAPTLYVELEDAKKPAPVKPVKSKVAAVPLYTVVLYFVDPEYSEAGKRTFDIQIQGKTYLKQFDIAKLAGGKNKAITKTFKNIEVKDVLKLKLVDLKKGQPLLSGIELIAEESEVVDKKTSNVN